jgi:hypothetical protein
MAAAVTDCQAVSHFAIAFTSQATSNTFALAAAGSKNAAYVVPPSHVPPAVTFTATTSIIATSTVAIAITVTIAATSTAAVVIVDSASPTVLAHHPPHLTSQMPLL